MNDELIDRIDNMLSSMASNKETLIKALGEEGKQGYELAANLLQDCKAALTQQREAEPDGYVYEFVSPFSGAPVWRHDSGEWNGQRPKSSRPYFFHPPKPVAKDVEKLLRKAFELGKQWWMQADSESYKQNKLADQTMSKFEDLLSAAKEEGK